MTGYGISDVPTIELGDEEQNLLSDGMHTQAVPSWPKRFSLDDEWDNVDWPGLQIACSSGARCIPSSLQCLLFDSQKRLLLQRRASDKVTFPDVWANSCCSHPLHSEEEMDETNAIGVKRAAVRKLEQELGISPEPSSFDAFHFITKMRYSARMNETGPNEKSTTFLVIQADVDRSKPK